MTQSPPDAERWLSAYVVYAGPQERLLLDVVAPFAERALAEGRADRFFFIRYGDGGPHLRLRFRGAPDALAALRGELEAECEAFFRRHPAAPVEPRPAPPGEPERPLLPHATVQYAEYEPETERYGGPAGLDVAERHFMASSRAVMALIAERQAGWSYEQALGAALQLNLTFAHALGMDGGAAVAFFDRLAEALLPYTLLGPDGRFRGRLSPEARERLLDAFDRSFRTGHARVAPAHEALWRGLDRGAAFPPGWMADWYRDSARLGAELREADLRGALHFPEWWFELNPHVSRAPGERLIFILSSLVHMTCNRLGVLNRDEAYLAYVLRRSLAPLVDGADPAAEDAAAVASASGS